MKKLIIFIGLLITIPGCSQDFFWSHTGYSRGYGLLYNGYVAITNKICPTGWHLPVEGEWNAFKEWLEDSGYGYGGSGTDFAFALADTINWITSGSSPGTPGYNQSTNNTTFFNGKPCGFRNPDGEFIYEYTGSYWATPEYFEFEGYDYYRFYYIYWGSSAVVYSSQRYTAGFPVRCIKDNLTGGGTVTDYDGNIYNVRRYGDQIWTTSNLKVIHYNDGIEIPNITDNAAWASATSGAWCVYNNDGSNK